MNGWTVDLYRTASGKPVVADFINSLDTVTYAKVIRKIDLLEIYGADLGMPHTKSLGDGLFELRVRGKREVRVFYVHAAHRRIYLLHGFIKKTQATPKKELKVARDRQKEIERL